MVDPVVALAAFGGLVVLLVALFWPATGVVPRLSRLVRETERVRIEDALKHLYNCEYGGTSATVESLAGTLEVSRHQAVRLSARLEEMDLARSFGGRAQLTDEGRAYALRVLRTHRLWERYLADRTGVQPDRWHEEAERREHTLSRADAESLASRLGHPLYDPHGDPIPTVDGDLPPRSGVPLTSLRPGDVAAIVHLEDEPTAVFQRLVDVGLTVLMRVEVLDSPPGVVRFRAGGVERELEPVVAANVTVERLPEAEAEPFEVRTLADVERGESARVVGISPACQGPQRRRLLDLGVVPGTVITAELEAAGGDPLAYDIRGALVALRREQARWVEVDPHVTAGTA